MSLRIIGRIHVIISSFSSNWSSCSMSCRSIIETLWISHLIFSLFNRVAVIIFFLIWSIILILCIIIWNASIALNCLLFIISLCRDCCLGLRGWCIISKLSFKSKHSYKISRSFNFLMINSIFILSSKLFIFRLI